jgi:glutamate dehydrogenase
VLPGAVAALDIVAVSTESGEDLAGVAATHFAIADRLDLTWLRDRILALPRDTQWSTLARLTLRSDLYADHRELTALVLAGTDPTHDAAARLDDWVVQNRSDVDRYRQTMVAIRSTVAEVTSLLVAAREVRNLINRVRPA